MTETPRPVRATRPAVPASVETAIQRALAKAPADRFASCGGFARVAIVAAAAWWWSTAETQPGASPSTAPVGKSIAVLPLVNVGGDSTQEYFADGMTDEITDALGKVPGLRVAARTSSFSFKGRRDLDVREVGEKLGVGVVLQGSVRRFGDRVKVSVPLIDAAERVELWADGYDQAVGDIFAVQDSMTGAIVRQLALTLRGADLAATTAGRTSDPEAHDLYLQGLSLVHQGTELALRRSLEYFRAALARDPDYAQAYVGVSWAYTFLADAYMVAAVAYDSARSAAREAFDRGSQAGEAVVATAYGAFVTDWDVTKVGPELQRGLATSPNSADVRAVSANWLCIVGRIDAGLAEADQAIALDHLAPLGGFVREWCLYIGRRYDDVIAKRARAANPRFAAMVERIGLPTGATAPTR